MARKPSGSDGPLQTALLEASSAAAARAAEGQKVFSLVAPFLDEHRDQTSNLPLHMQQALASLSDELSAVAQRHFNSYIHTSEPLPPSPIPRPPTPPPSRPPSGLALSTYATVARSPAPTRAAPTAEPPKKPTPHLQETGP